MHSYTRHADNRQQHTENTENTQRHAENTQRTRGVTNVHAANKTHTDLSNKYLHNIQVFKKNLKIFRHSRL